MENNNVEKKGKKKSIDESKSKNEKISSPKKVAKKSNTLNSTEVEVKKVVKKTNPTERKTSGSQIDTAKKGNTKNSSKTTSGSSKRKEEKQIDSKSDSKDAPVVRKRVTTKKEKQEAKNIISEIEEDKDDASSGKAVKKTVSSATKKTGTKGTKKSNDRLEDISRNKMGKSVTLKSSKEVKDDDTTSIDRNKSVKKSSSVRRPVKNEKELPEEVNVRKSMEEPSKVVRTRKNEKKPSKNVKTGVIEDESSGELKAESSERTNKVRAKKTSSVTKKTDTAQNLSTTGALKRAKKESDAIQRSEKNKKDVATTVRVMNQSSSRSTTISPKGETVIKSKSRSSKSASKSTTKITPKASEKSANAKKRISQSVERATSEKSGGIKINVSGNASKGDSVVRRSNSKKSAKKVNSEIMKDQESVDEYDKDLSISFLDDDFNEKFDINKLNQEIKNRRYVSMEDNISIVKNSFYNIIFAVVFILFLVFCNYGYYNIEKVAMIKNVNLFSYIFLIVSIMFIETAYKEEKLNKCINGLETLAMGVFTLFIPYMLQKYTSNFIKALITSGVVIFLYYVIKSIVVFFVNRSKFIRAKDDVSKDNEDRAFDFDEEDDDIDD